MSARYPVWKHALLIIVVAVAIIYALPNIYPEVPAVQISHVDHKLTKTEQKKIERVLDQQKLPYTALEFQSDTGALLIRTADSEDQLQIAEVLREQFRNQYITALNLASDTPQWLASLGADPMNLGLDLRGGVYFMLAVDTEAALSKALNRYQDELRDILPSNNVIVRNMVVTKDFLKVTVDSLEDKSKTESIIKNRFSQVFEFEEKSQDTELILSLSKQQRKNEINFAVQQNIITLRKRVNEIGVAEPVVTRQGRDRIVVQLPGVQDTVRAKEILGATATLEFRLVAEGQNAERAKRLNNAPRGTQLYFERGGAPVLLKKKVMLTGDYIIDADSGIDSQTARPAVFITLDGKGARIFSRVTGANVKRLMAVVFIENKVETYRDESGVLKKNRTTTEEVINTARIQAKLSKRFQITGLDSPTEARKLALLLRAGALAAPLEIIEERTVGPSLGQENIDQGRNSIILGFLLVIVFMGIYYRRFGLIADLALTVNIFLIIAVMSLIPGATLTLPGIVGIVLTVGMAVDANVLIFERIREEMRGGNSPAGSIEAGYRQAFSTIADANVTTLIAALVLFAFGTGSIKGFAVTLSIGIVSSMFTAIMGTRAIVSLLYENKKQNTLLI